MSEFAPAAIRGVFDRLVVLAPGMELDLGGILGDSAHTYGYHRARAVLPDDDYSVVLRRDRLGPRWAASALDVTPRNATDVRLLTTRLAGAVAREDPRITRCVREFYGTLNGTTVYGWDLHARAPSISDASHLWHVHISFYRKFACRPRVLAPVAEVLAGV